MIKKISIKNFKLFSKIELELNQLTLLTGTNSSGKSSIIQTILLLMQNRNNHSLLEKRIYLNGDYVELGTLTDITNYQANENVEIITELNDGNLIKLFVDKYEREAEYLSTDASSVAHINKLTDKIEYLCSYRISPLDLYPKSSNLSRTSLLNSTGINGELTFSFLKNQGEEKCLLESLIHEDGKTSILSLTNEWLGYISPGVNLDVQLIGRSNYVLAEFRYPGHMNTPHKPINVGNGITYVVPVITALIKAKKGEIVIIENPEAHIHPAGQTKLGELISLAVKDGVQVIIETHSDHIINGIRKSVSKGILSNSKCKFVFLKKDYVNNCVETHYPKLDNNGNFDFYPNNFFDEWELFIDSMIEWDIK